MFAHIILLIKKKDCKIKQTNNDLNPAKTKEKKNWFKYF